MAGLWACAAGGQTLQIDGNPLRIAVDPDGTIGVSRYQSGTPVPQFYATFAKGTALFLNGTNTNDRWGNGTSTFALWDNTATGRFSTVSHVQSNPMEIRTVLDAGTMGVQVTQTVSYVNGQTRYTIAWDIARRQVAPPKQTIGEIRLIHGGDVAPGGTDFASGAWDAASNFVSVAAAHSNAVSMGLRGDPSSPADTHYEAHFQLVRDAAKSGNLPGTVVAAPHDAAYALQWNRARLAPGETWRIVAHEIWSGEAFAPVFEDVSDLLRRPLTLDWTLNRQTGTYFGTLQLENTGKDGMWITEPFWLVMQSSVERRFMAPGGTTGDGREYLDVSAAVNNALGDGKLDPGDRVTIPGIEVYMRYRQPPPDALFAIFGTRTR